MDLVAASVDASLGIVEDALIGEDFVNRRAPTRRVILTEDVMKIAGQQGRYGVEHGCCFSSSDRVPLALMYPTPQGRCNQPTQAEKFVLTFVVATGGVIAIAVGHFGKSRKSSSG